MDYYTKYLKYKNKYLVLKKMYGGYVEYVPNKNIWITEKSDQYSKDEAELFTLLKLKIGHWYSTKLKNGNYKISDNQRYINFISHLPMILFEKAVENNDITYEDFQGIQFSISKIIQDRIRVSNKLPFSQLHQDVIQAWENIHNHYVMKEIQQQLLQKQKEIEEKEEKEEKEKVEVSMLKKKEKEIEKKKQKKKKKKKKKAKKQK